MRSSSWLLHQGTQNVLGAIAWKFELPRFGQESSRFQAMRIFQREQLPQTQKAPEGSQYVMVSDLKQRYEEH